MLARWDVLIPFSIFLVVSPSASEWRSTEIDYLGTPPGQTPDYKGNASIIIDEILGAVSAYLRKSNHTEIDIPDQESDFNFVRMPTVYFPYLASTKKGTHKENGKTLRFGLGDVTKFLLNGHLSLSKGKLSGYDLMERVGDAEVEYFDKGTSGSAAVKFADASAVQTGAASLTTCYFCQQFFYKMKVNFASSTFEGTIKASLEQLSMRINTSVNLTSLCKKIDSVKVENLNSIKVNVDIHSWIPGTLTNTLVNTVTRIYKSRLVPSIEERTAKAIQSFLDKLDLDDWLRPTTEFTVEHIESEVR